MRATMMHKAGDVRIANVPDAAIQDSTDAVIRVTRDCICGSDLWPYNDLPETPSGRPMGHEAIGIVEEVGSDVGAVTTSTTTQILVILSAKRVGRVSCEGLPR
jgi:threonine dehydrogenase-like Zn-dependent dehydrogenase